MAGKAPRLSVIGSYTPRAYLQSRSYSDHFLESKPRLCTKVHHHLWSGTKIPLKVSVGTFLFLFPRCTNFSCRYLHIFEETCFSSRDPHYLSSIHFPV